MTTPAQTKPLFTPHPLWDREWPPLTTAQIQTLLAQPNGQEELIAYVEGHERRLVEEQADPLRKGFDLPHWKAVRHLFEQKDETYCLGANGSAKTELGGKLVSELLCSIRGKRVLCVAQNDDASRDYQQKAVYKYLPVAARSWNGQSRKRRGIITKINWSQGGGFTEGTFVLPNASQCFFKTVAQYLRDPISFEGPAYDLVWIDEGAPLGLVDTLRVRAGKSAGKFLLTFTAVHGYDATCGSVLEGARVIKSLPMNWDWMHGAEGGENPAVSFPELRMNEVQVKGCPPGHMPFLVQPLDFAKGVVFTWTHWNPFLPRGKWNPLLPAIFDKCVGRAKWQVRVRLFGWVEKMTGCQIANFNPQVHVIPHERIEALLKAGKLTTYMADDPGTTKSSFLCWKGVDQDGNEYIFDESPRADEGEWVSADGAAGEGQQVYAGVGSNWYKRHIREREKQHGREAEKRFGDPRAFATAAAAAEGGTNLFELYAQDGEDGSAETAGMLFAPARIRQTVNLDLDNIVTKLAYDTQKPVTVENQPHLYVSDRCQNTIRAWLNWDGKPDSPWKDPVDASRYLFCEPTPFMDPDVPMVSGGGGWG